MSACNPLELVLKAAALGRHLDTCRMVFSVDLLILVVGTGPCTFQFISWPCRNGSIQLPPELNLTLDMHPTCSSLSSRFCLHPEYRHVGRLLDPAAFSLGTKWQPGYSSAFSLLSAS